MTITTEKDDFGVLRKKLKKLNGMHRYYYRKSEVEKNKILERLVKENLVREQERYITFLSFIATFNQHFKECMKLFGEQKKFIHLSPNQKERFKQIFDSSIHFWKEILQEYFGSEGEIPKGFIKLSREDIEIWKEKKAKELTYQYHHTLHTELRYSGVKEWAGKPHLHVAFNVIFPWTWLDKCLGQNYHQKDNWRESLPPYLRHEPLASIFWGRTPSTPSSDLIKLFRKFGYGIKELKDDKDLTFEQFLTIHDFDQGFLISNGQIAKISGYIAKYLSKAMQKVHYPILHSSNIPQTIQLIKTTEEKWEHLGSADHLIEENQLIPVPKKFQKQEMQSLKDNQVLQKHSVSQEHRDYFYLEKKAKWYKEKMTKEDFKKWKKNTYTAKCLAILEKRLQNLQPIHGMFDLEQIGDVEGNMKLELSKSQKEAMVMVNNNESAINIIRGEGGTGKTLLICVLSQLFKGKKDEIAIVAFTASAVSRIKEELKKLVPPQSRPKAMTIHQLGMSDFNNRFFVDGHLRRKEKLYLIDEGSMLNHFIFLKFTLAIPDNCKVIVFGDPVQLPPITGQSALQIISKHSKEYELKENHRSKNNPFWLHTLRLTRIGAFPKPRQINQAELQEIIGKGKIKDFMIICNSNSLVNLVNHTYSKTRKADLIGFTQSYAIGDPVIINKNIYRKDVFNGEIGTIKKIKKINEETYQICIEFSDGRKKTFEKNAVVDETINFDLAYAISIHKAQGSEWSKGIVIIDPTKPKLVTLEMIYVALSRFKEYADFLVYGNIDQFNNIIKNRRI